MPHLNSVKLDCGPRPDVQKMRSDFGLGFDDTLRFVERSFLLLSLLQEVLVSVVTKSTTGDQLGMMLTCWGSLRGISCGNRMLAEAKIRRDNANHLPDSTRTRVAASYQNIREDIISCSESGCDIGADGSESHNCWN